MSKKPLSYYEKIESVTRPLSVTYNGSDETIGLISAFLGKTYEDSSAHFRRNILVVTEAFDNKLTKGDLLFSDVSGKTIRLSLGDSVIYFPLKNKIRILRRRKTEERFNSIQG